MKKLPFVIFYLCIIFTPVCLAADGKQTCVVAPTEKVVKKRAPLIFRPFVKLLNKITGKREPMTRPALDLECLELSRTEVSLSSSTGSQLIEVKATASMGGVLLDETETTFNYTVSGGKIIGADVIRFMGANVVWDLSGVEPGIYTITAGADNGCGVCGKTKTREVKIIE